MKLLILLIAALMQSSSLYYFDGVYYSANSVCRPPSDNPDAYQNLENVIIRDTVRQGQTLWNITGIREFAFSDSKRLKTISGNNIAYMSIYALTRCDSLEYVNFPNLRIIYMGAFSQSGIKSIDLSNVIEIGDRAFSACRRLESIILPPTLTEISAMFFVGCESLKSLDLQNVSSIGRSAMQNCSSLESIIVTGKLTNVGHKAVSGTAWLNAQPDGVVCLGNVVCDWKGELIDNRKVDINRGYYVGEGCFEGLDQMKELTIGEQVWKINKDAFKDCHNLRKLNYNATSCDVEPTHIWNYVSSPFPMNEDEIDNVPREIIQLEEVTFGNNVIRIPASLLVGQKKLKTIELPASLRTIESGAFRDCTGLRSVCCRFDNPNISFNIYNSFYGIPDDCVLYVPCGTLISFKQSEEWNKVFKIIKEYPQKDINGDGNIDIADLNIAINIMLHKEDVTAPYEADVNADGTVDIADINMIINGILGK